MGLIDFKVDSCAAWGGFGCEGARDAGGDAPRGYHDTRLREEYATEKWRDSGLGLMGGGEGVRTQKHLNSARLHGAVPRCVTCEGVPHILANATAGVRREGVKTSVLSSSSGTPRTRRLKSSLPRVAQGPAARPYAFSLSSSVISCQRSCSPVRRVSGLV